MEILKAEYDDGDFLSMIEKIDKSLRPYNLSLEVEKAEHDEYEVVILTKIDSEPIVITYKPMVVFSVSLTIGYYTRISFVSDEVQIGDVVSLKNDKDDHHHYFKVVKGDEKYWDAIEIGSRSNMIHNDSHYTLKNGTTLNKYVIGQKLTKIEDIKFLKLLFELLFEIERNKIEIK